jgi:DNA-binding GntR family transcriptional regulator
MVCHVRAASLEELAMLLKVGRQTVRGHCRNLAHRGELVLDANGRYSVASPSPAEAK